MVCFHRLLCDLSGSPAMPSSDLLALKQARMRDGCCKLSRDEGPGVGDLAQHGARDGGDPETGE